MRRAFVSLLTLYQYLISPLYSPCCRFTPSCSEYARQAVLSHGIVRGMGLTLRRLVRCHPLCAGGYDPVPVPNLSKRE
ncbi:MAG: membrane protein insertion efficiency factor YidD [Desulfovibrionales bacterium]|nr:membrane protein insertion efficiency factor YidD [Desulfovibrionales bacterium]